MSQHNPIPHIPGYTQIKLWSQKGGMGNIFKARAAKTGEEVIIKVMKLPVTATEEDLPYYAGLFKFETDLALSFKSDEKHVLKALAHGYITSNGYPYLVYPFIQDGSLDNLMDAEHPWSNTNWSLLEIADTIIQVAEGLAVLHRRNPPIVHQDIKPGNLLWKPDRAHTRRVHLWISDFGTARWEMDEQHETTPIGTRQYMAPEQFHGKVRCTTDQFALAIVARYLLTGSKPAAGPGNTSPPPARLVNPPPTLLNPLRLRSNEIDWVLIRALAEQADERYPDVTQFAQELYKAIFQQEHPTSHFTPTFTPGFYDAITDSPPLGEARKQVDTHLSLAIPAHNGQLQPEEIEASPDIPPPRPRQIQVIDTPMPQAPAKSGKVETPSLLLTHLQLQECFRAKLPSTPTALSWSQDGNILLCTFLNDAPLLIYRDGHMETISVLRGHLACWSRDSRYIAISSYNLSSRQAFIGIWDRANPTASTIKHMFNCETAINGLSWSSRGQLAAWINNELLLFTASEQTPFVQFPDLSRVISVSDMRCSTIGTMQWSPDGSLLAAGGDNGTLFCWDANSQQTSACTPIPRAPIQSLAWFADKPLLAISSINRRVAIWDMVSKREIKSWNELAELPRMISVSPHDFTVSLATKNHLLFGSLQEQTLSFGDQGHLVASWSPRAELATVREHKDTMLIILQNR